jgi:hypothetical protein
MSINQISQANTFGQLITAVSAVIAVANNLVDGPEVVSNSTWTFSNPGVGVNVGNTALIGTANIGVINTPSANILVEVVGDTTIDTAAITTANIVAATITDLWTTDHHTANANVSGLLQVSDRANIFSANIETANIGSLALTTLALDSLTVPVLNASFANITTLSVSGTSQHLAIIATLVTTDNANVRIINVSLANISNSFVETLNATSANITTLTVGTQNISVANVTLLTVPTLNSSQANLTNETVGRSNVSSANITSANITTLFANVANIVSGNIAVANITTLASLTTITSNPTANLGLATKNYVDLGAGANLVNKLSFGAKGDLIVGSGANTYATLNSGTNGQMVIVDTNQTNNLRYTNRSTQLFRGLTMGTSLADKVANGTQVVVYSLSEAVMDDGEVVASWTTPAAIDIAVSGAGGLDGGTANANSWYEVYAIRKRSDGTKNFIFHRALTRFADQNVFSSFYPYTATTGYGLDNSGNTTNYTRFAQSFTPNVSGQLTSIEIRAFKTGTPGGNIWLTLEGNTAGSPNSTTLATSRKMDVSRLQITNTQNLKFIFDTTATVNVATSYFWTVNMDNAASATQFVNVAFSAANTDLAANGVNRGLPYGFAGSWQQLTSVGTFLYKTHVESNNNPVTLPAGYDQKCLISYAATDVNNKIKEYHQKDRTIMTYFTSQWASFPTIAPVATGADIMDLQVVVPPITCMVSFLIFGTSVAQSCVIARVHALDLPAPSAIAEGTVAAGGVTWATSAAGSVAMPPSPPIWVEQQVILTRVQTLASKFYPCSITF